MSKENFIERQNCKHIAKKENINDYVPNRQLIQLINSSFRFPENEERNNKEIITIYKIISLGASREGKTSIFKRLLKEKFEFSYNATIYIELSEPYYVKYKNKKYKLFFYDSGGQEKYISELFKNYMRQSDGVLFVFDISNRESFDDLKSWYNLYKAEKENVVGVIIGNKCNIEFRQVDYDEAKAFADSLGLEYLETSAKLDKKIKKAIVYLLDDIIESKADFDSLTIGSDTDVKMFQLVPGKFKKESFCDRFCKKLKSWFS